jgi:hypothetical protein
MIDLTQEESPMKTMKKSRVPKANSRPVPVLSPVPAIIPSITPPARSRHSVTFAPIVESRSPSPPAYNRDHLASSSPDVTETMHREYFPFSRCCA